MSYGFDFLFLLRHVMILAIVGSVIVSIVAAWNLLRARASGAKLMLFGLGLQCALGVMIILMYVSPISPDSLRGPILTIRLYMASASYCLSMIGILCFAIGFFLHAKKQRGLQVRVEELERILSDLHSRER